MTLKSGPLIDEGIFDCIEAGINRCAFISEKLNAKDSTVNQRLSRLKAKHELYSRRTTIAGHLAVIWFIGRDPELPIDLPAEPYPITAGREFFTFFLFGAPKASSHHALEAA